MTPIPAFPTFRRLSYWDRAAIERLTAQFPPYSDFGFTSLWVWDTDETCAISRHGGNLIVRFKDFTSNDHFYSFIGQDRIPETVELLLSRARDEGLAAQLRLVPEITVRAEPRLVEQFIITEDRDNFDYVYSLADWASFPSPRFQRHQKRLELCCQQTTLANRELDVSERDVQDAMRQLFHTWVYRQGGSGCEDARHERAALERLFALPDKARIAAFGAYDGDQLAGFAIWEGLPDGRCSVSHFQKADRSYGELSSWLAHSLGKRLSQSGYQQLNAEQDLGIPGLRNYKRSLQPCHYLRKYTIKPCGGD